MKRLSIFLTLIVALLFAASAVEVAQGELGSTSGRDIQFKNYEGPHAQLDSVEDILNIGSGLGGIVSKRLAKPETFNAGDPTRYSVIHAVDPKVDKGLDADILVIGAGASVDHIDNLRLIIRGYLQSAYGYKASDAILLAKFVTIYNAVYRQNLDYFKGKYKNIVLDNLTKAKAGLGLSYTEWAGNSQIVIPLSSATPQSGKLGTVNTTPLSEKAVVQNLKTQPDAGTKDRQDLVDLKDRQIDQDKAKLEADKAKIKADEDKIAADKAKIAEEQAKVNQAKASPGTTASPGANASPGSSASPGSNQVAVVSPGASSPATTQSSIDKQKEDVAQREADLQKQKDQAAKDEAAIKAKQAETDAERAQIQADQQAKINAEAAAKAENDRILAASLYGIQVLKDNTGYAQIALLDTINGKTLKVSSIVGLRARSVLLVGDSFIAIAGEKTQAGAIRLVLIDRTSLSIVKQGEDDMFPDSLIWQKDGNYYAVFVAKDGKNYLGRFDGNLVKTAQSDVPVFGYTNLQFSDKGLLAQAEAGGFVLMDLKDMKKSKEIK